MAEEQNVLVKASDITNALQAGNTLLGRIIQTLESVFPLATGTDSSATGGAATLPANPVGFIEVYVPSLGATKKVPYYDL